MIVLYTKCEGGKFFALKTKLKGRRLLKFLKRPTSGILSFYLSSGAYWYRGMTEYKSYSRKYWRKDRKERYKHFKKYFTDPEYKKQIDEEYRKIMNDEVNSYETILGRQGG